MASFGERDDCQRDSKCVIYVQEISESLPIPIPGSVAPKAPTGGPDKYSTLMITFEQ